MLHIVVLLHIMIVGFMIFFISIVSPSVFKTLDEENIGKFLRVIFPRMFIYGFILSFLAFLISLFEAYVLYWLISLFSSILFLLNTYVVTPKINIYSDRYKVGDLDFEIKFKRAHFISVAFFLLQLFGSLFLIILFF